MLYTLRLHIHYRFDRPSGGGRQLLRVTPADLPGRQDLLAASVRVTPAPLETRRFTDFFGTEVFEVVMPAGLTEMQVEMEARVDRPALGPGLDMSTPLPEMAGALQEYAGIGRESPWHFLAASPRIPDVPEIAAFASRVTKGTQSALQAVEALGRALHKRMAFDAGATTVDTAVAEAFALSKGVCQDFAQIMICGLRALGVPAGYIGGYLRTLPPPGKPRLQGADAMHAWVGAWLGPRLGWVQYDPTNAVWVDADHIIIGYGRDYADVAPVTGSLRLDGEQSGSHSVDILEEAAR